MAQRSLAYGDLAYPERPPFFVLHALGAFIGSEVMASLPPRSTQLFLMVAMTEDKRRYKAPPTFYASQLSLFIGVHKDNIPNIREPLVEAGWLHYVHQGNRRPGYYWVMIPPEWEDAGRIFALQVLAPVMQPVIAPAMPPAFVPQSYPPSYPLPVPIPSATPSDEAAADGELIELLKEAQVEVAPDNVLAGALKAGHSRDAIRSRIRYFLDRRAWGPGFLVFSLRHPDYVGKPAEFGWPALPPEKAKAEQVAAEQSRHASARVAADEQQARLRSRDQRLRQLQLQFDEVVRSRTPKELGEQLALPDAIRQRLAAHPRWDTIRNDDLRLMVLERLAAGEGSQAN